METKSRYEVIAELEEKKRQLLLSKDNLGYNLNIKKKELKNMKRAIEDKEEEIKEFEESMESQKETLNELIKSTDGTLERLSGLNKTK